MPRRRSQKSETPLNFKQEDLAKRDAQLRAEIEKVERMIADAPKRAEEVSRRHREELSVRAKEGKSRLDVTMDLERNRWPNESGPRRRVSLRKERREGRLIFLVLVIALAATVIWLATHLHF